MSKKASKCSVKAVIRYDNGDRLEIEYADLKPDVALGLVELFKSHRMEAQKDGQ